MTQTLDAVLAKGQTMPEKNRFPAVLVPSPVVLDRAAFNQGVNAQYDPHIKESEQMVALVAKGPHAVGFPVGRDMKVRMITELEAERLQGFPDNHTQISWKGKAPEDCPAGHRYKAIGNSWAVPCARWIGERIEIVNSILDETKNKIG